MNKYRKLYTLSLLVLAIPRLTYAQNNGMSAAQAKEIANLDAVATMIGTTDSWIRTEPEAAIHLFAHHQRMLAYIRTKLDQYSSAGTGRDPFSRRLRDRKKQLDQALRHWENTVPRYKEVAPSQIATDLKGQRDAVERYKKSKRPRPSSFAYIPKMVWNTKAKLNVLTAAGVDTMALQKEQQEVEKMVLDLVKSMDAAELAKSTLAPRDGYRRDDRSAIEQFVTRLWKMEHADQPIERIVMPQQSWSNTYGATVDAKSNEIVPHEVERITVYVAVRKTAEILTLYPVRLMQMNFKINGKRLGKTEPYAMQRIPTLEFPFDVLASKLR